jgi:hypothetical protein
VRMDHDIVQNRPVLLKTDKTSGTHFVYENLLINFEICKNFEIKNSKKTRVYFKILDQN